MALLTHLPVELVEEIVAGLCIACTPIETRCCYNSNCYCAEMGPADLARISALASLCLTSRHLNNIATRHLYHHVHGQQWWLLARTLLSRKDLAQLIRSMRIGFGRGVNEADCPPQVVAYYNSQRKIYLDALPENYRNEAIYHLGNGKLYAGDGNIQIDILSSLCPNLETLEAIISYFEVFRFCAPHSMPHLRSVVLSHSDTELGIDLGNVALLFRAAPNITHALFYMVNSCGKLDATLPKLTSLDFQSSTFDGPSLVEILSTCPNLETFRYEMGGAIVGHEQFTIQEAQDVFLAHAVNLEWLCLEAGDNYNWEDEWDAAEASEMGELLAERGVRFEFKPCDWEHQVDTSRPFAP
ncbi:hypothetical protein QBC43DRAFT_202808 [Cladorrhinum sp. PSN259]|nr:hypothetical protein QBC43DRAFT_202808 [Cladorrhinum sp. PSN259]